MKIYAENVAIEVTRRCNMHCAHCMRGEAENKDLSVKMLDEFLSQFDEIGFITFTGGEPTLRLSAIRETLRYCREHGIQVYGFYLVTNGKRITQAFLNTMIAWYAYCLECGGDEEYCGVALSLDPYHAAIDRKNLLLLRSLSFFRENDKKNDGTNLINLGRARSLAVDKRDPVFFNPIEALDVTQEDGILYVNNCTLSLTVNGDVLTDSDYEYDNVSDLKICQCDRLTETITRIATDPWFKKEEIT